jgi:hypothetical protein
MTGLTSAALITVFSLWMIPTGVSLGAPMPPKLSVGLHAVDAPERLTVLDHVVIVRASAAEGEGHGARPGGSVLM